MGRDEVLQENNSGLVIFGSTCQQNIKCLTDDQWRPSIIIAKWNKTIWLQFDEGVWWTDSYH